MDTPHTMDDRLSEELTGALNRIAELEEQLAACNDAAQKIRQNADIQRDKALKAAFNSVCDAIIVHTLTGKILLVNDRMVELFGLTDANAALARSADQYYRTQGATEPIQDVWKRVREGQCAKFECLLERSRDNESFDAEVFVRTIPLDDQDLLLACIRDISARKKDEEKLSKALETASRLRWEADAANRAKSEFLSTMSHELRTPLNSILGFSNLLEDEIYGKLNNKQMQFVKHISHSGSHLLELINDVLDLTKIEAGKMDLHVNPVPLAQIMENCVQLVKERVLRRSLEIEVIVSEDVRDLKMMVDEVKLIQVISNLLSNAVKFTPDEGRITLKAEQRNGEICISVTDTGIGLAQVDLLRIFEEFEQVDSSYARHQEGTGLGLALARKLVELHSGRIWAESDGLGKGSKFSFVIPHHPGSIQDTHSADGQTQGETIDKRPPSRTQEESRKKSILVIEDDEANMDLAAALLERLGFTALQAVTAEEGLERALKENPSLILMDQALPGMDGLEATRILKQNPLTAHIPVVAVTAHAMKIHEQEAFNAGCDGYITKPVTADELSAVVERLIEAAPTAGP